MICFEKFDQNNRVFMSWNHTLKLLENFGLGFQLKQSNNEQDSFINSWIEISYRVLGEREKLDYSNNPKQWTKRENYRLQ